MAKRKKRWSYSVGVYGARVRAFERQSGILALAICAKGQEPRIKNLHHRDRARAVTQADETQAGLILRLGDAGPAPRTGATLDAFLARQRERDAELRPGALKDAEREVAFWKAALGADSDPTTLTQDDLERVMRLRRSGAIDARGKAVPAPDREPVRVRAVAGDLEFLRACLRWATLKRRLFRVNVMDGFEIPDEPNPRRPVATGDRFEATRAVAERVTMTLCGQGKRETVASWLPELLDLAFSTGRRIGAIVALRYEDLSVEVAPETAPFGSVRWPADTDKMGRAWLAPMDQRARGAVDRILVDREVGVRSRWSGSPWLFPSPRNANRPVSKDLASAWLEEAEALAKLPKLEGSLWHAYRRGWATARKHHPLSDVAAAGGWKDTTTLRTVYTQADPETVRRVVLEPMDLRDRT